MRNTLFFLVLTFFVFYFTFHTQAQIITTIAGNGTAGYTGDGIPATSAELTSPSGVAVDGSGNVYIMDDGNYRVRKVNTAGIITTIAGNGTAGFLGDGGPATNAEIGYSFFLAVDGGGNVFISDNTNNRIRKVNTAGIITTIAGNGTAGFGGDGGAATACMLNSPYGLAVDGAGNVYISDRANNRIRKISTTGIITTIAGNGTAGFAGDGGSATSAELDSYGLGVDASGNVYIADLSNRIRKVSTTGIITTIAGIGLAGFFGDGGPATAAELNHYPSDVAIDNAGNVFIADGYNHRIRMVNTTGIITTIAGNGIPFYSGDGGPATAAALNNGNGGLAVDGSGNVYIADRFNNRIRKIETIIVSTITGTKTVCVGASTNLSDSTVGGTWSSNNTTIAIVGSSTGIVTGVSAGIDSITYTVGLSNVVTTITVNPLPTPIISMVGGLLGTAPTYISYQWFVGSTSITGATDSTYTPISNGTYYVTVIDSNGCSGNSPAINVTNVSVPSINSTEYQISVYPNPVYSVLNIKSSTKINLRVSTIDGRTIVDEQNTNEIDVSKLANGIYLLSIFDSEKGIKIKTLRFTK